MDRPLVPFSYSFLRSVFLIPIIFFLLAAFVCPSADAWMSKVKKRWVYDVSFADYPQIQKLEEDQRIADGKYRKARVDAHLTKYHYDIAVSEHIIAREKLEIAEKKKKLLSKGALTEDVQAADDEIAVATHDFDVAKSFKKVRRQELKLTKARVTEAKKYQKLKDAELELAKAQIVRDKQEKAAIDPKNMVNISKFSNQTEGFKKSFERAKRSSDKKAQKLEQLEANFEEVKAGKQQTASTGNKG